MEQNINRIFNQMHRQGKPISRLMDVTPLEYESKRISGVASVAPETSAYEMHTWH